MAMKKKKSEHIAFQRLKYRRAVVDNSKLPVLFFFFFKISKSKNEINFFVVDS